MTQPHPTTAPRRPRVTLLAAVAANGVIGRGNDLPWRLPEDLKRFKALTLGHPVLMGRRTFDSIIARNGKPLPGRRNLVVSRSMPEGKLASGAEVYRTLGGALAGCENAGEEKPIGEIFVIGGAAIYALAMPLADRLQLTEIAEPVAGDTYFPPYDRGEFAETSREPGAPGGELRYDFVVYDRVKRPATA